MSIVLITPLTLIDNLNPVIQIIEAYVSDFEFVKIYAQYFLTPLCLYIFNYVMIPFLIDFLIRFEERSRK